MQVSLKAKNGKFLVLNLTLTDHKQSVGGQVIKRQLYFSNGAVTDLGLTNQ